MNMWYKIAGAHCELSSIMCMPEQHILEMFLIFSKTGHRLVVSRNSPYIEIRHWHLTRPINENSVIIETYSFFLNTFIHLVLRHTIFLMGYFEKVAGYLHIFPRYFECSCHLWRIVIVPDIALFIYHACTT